MLGEQRLCLRAEQPRLERGGPRLTRRRRGAGSGVAGRGRRPRRTRRFRATRPPTTEVPPPNGTSATCRSLHHSTTEATSSWSAGSTTASGASSASPARILSRSGVDLPRVCRTRASRSTWTCSSPSRSRSSASSAGASATSGTRTAVRAAGVSSTAGPKAASTRARAASARGCARSGSPQRAQCIGVVMRYTVTHDVNSSQHWFGGRAPRRGPPLHPRGGLEADDADRRRPARGRLPDDDLPALAGHADAALGPDDPGVVRGGFPGGRR